jgi:hypothetical protein
MDQAQLITASGEIILGRIVAGERTVIGQGIILMFEIEATDG